MQEQARQLGLGNVEFHRQAIEAHNHLERYDVVIMDNVLEHIKDRQLALMSASQALKLGGLLYLVVPNKLWPIEAHYGLPFLSYLPVALANVYIRVTRRGHRYSDDYTACAYTPTYWALKRLLSARCELSFRFVVPDHFKYTKAGPRWHYRVGARLLRNAPWLWCLSKAFVVIAQKVEAERDLPPQRSVQKF